MGSIARRQAQYTSPGALSRPARNARPCAATGGWVRRAVKIPPRATHHERRTSTMPSPVGHSLAGLIAYQIAPEIDGMARGRVVALYLLAANAPDLDFLPGLIVGDPNRFHHGISHS